MKDNFSVIKDHKYWRLLEVIPATLSLSVLLIPIVLAVYKPDYVALFILIYSLYWLFRSVKLSIRLFVANKKYSHETKIDYHKRLKFLNNPQFLQKEINNSEDKNKKELLELQKQIVTIKKVNQFKNWQDLYQVIMLLTYKEDKELLKASIRSYAQSNYAKEKLILILAGEERDKENFLKIFAEIKEEFSDDFADLFATIHPKDTPGEIKGKSANATHSAKEIKKYLDGKNINYEDVLLSNFDADSVVHPNYFTELSYRYIITEDRTRQAYQPLHLYHNNIWQVPMLIRLIALSCSFWKMADSINLKRFKSFSSRSNSFANIVNVDYWDPAVIPEDSRQYWTSFMKYKGKHKVIPLYSPLYMDAVLSPTKLKTFQNQYLQLRRWAWGVCDFPFVFLNLFKVKEIPLSRKLYHIFFLLENHFSWATAPLIITFTGWLPGLMNKDFNDTTLSYKLPQVTSSILSLALVGIATFIILSFKFLPKPPKEKRTPFLYFTLVIQWVFIPVVSIVLSSLPALEAQIRLMIGKRLDYNVTEKARLN